MRIGPRTGAVAAVVAAGLLLSGCVVGGDTTVGTSTFGSADINAQPRSALRDGGNFRTPLRGFPANFNGLMIDGNDVDVAAIISPVLPSSVLSDATGKISVDHDYFTDIKLVSTTPQTVIFTINPKAVWSDGTPITWEDLASEAKALSGRDPSFQITTSSGYDRIASVVRGVDDRQAVITFAKPYGQWLSLFSLVYPKAVTATADSFNNSVRDNLPVTSGPFKITQIDKGQNRIVLGRDPRWWGDKPKLDTMTFIVLDPTAQIAALQNNEIDAFEQNEAIGSLSQIKSVKSAADVDVRQTPDPSNMNLTYNGAPGGILSDPALRVAISKGLDRSGLAKAALFGLTANPVPLNNHVFIMGQQGYQDNSKSVAYNPAEAERQLDALGWHKHGDVREKDGRQLVVRYATTQSQSSTEIAQIVQQNWATIGVKVDIQSHPGTGFFSDVIDQGKFDVAIFGWTGSTLPLTALDQIFFLDPNNPMGNHGHIGTPEINALIDQLDQELNPDKAITKANVIDQKLFEEGFSVPLFQEPGNYPCRSNVANYGAFGLATPDYTKIGFMK